MTIQDIMNQIKAIKGDYQNGLLTSDEMVEHLEVEFVATKHC